MYFVKTRNWHCKRWVKLFLDISKLWGIERGDCYEDGDGKYLIDTNNKFLALFTWYYFMIFYPFSGGWTYVSYKNDIIKNSDPEDLEYA
jgi:hypothetical protein